MSNTGVKKYVPLVVVQEIAHIKNSKGLRSDSEAFKKMVEFNILGQELDRLMRLDFRSARRNKP